MLLEQDNSSLHVASGQGRLDMVRFLVAEVHVDVNLRKEDGQTPLYCAITGLYIDSTVGVGERLEAERKIEKGDRSDLDAFESKRLQVINFLLEHGANVRSIDMVAAENNPRVKDVLRQHVKTSAASMVSLSLPNVAEEPPRTSFNPS